MEAKIAAGEAVFWPGERSAIVTEFIDYPRHKALHFWLSGGDMDELVERMQPIIEAWGRALGCTHSGVAGREGWKRVLNAKGYRERVTILTKELRP